MKDKDNIYKIHGYISVATTILNALLLVPVKLKEIPSEVVPLSAIRQDQVHEQGTGFVGKVSLGISLIAIGSTYLYVYNKYIKLNTLTKWLVFSFVTLSLMTLVIIIYSFLSSTALKKISKIILPILFLGLAVWHIIAMAHDDEDATAYRILYSINGIVGMANFLPLDKVLKTHPEAYVPIHAIRALLKGTEGVVLGVELKKGK